MSLFVKYYNITKKTRWRRDFYATGFGSKTFYSGVAIHRVNGPAYISKDGELGWYLNGAGYSKEQYHRIMKKREAR